jgi:hypothetical protein
MSRVIWGQSMVESAAAASGGSVGGVAGKKVSDGLSRIFNKVDQHAARAAKSAEDEKKANAPLLEVGPGVPKAGFVSVPPPPPAVVRHAAVHAKPAPRSSQPPPIPVIVPPPPPDVTAEDLKTVSAGMTRDDVLKIAPPSVRITMFDDGHLVEIYRYMAKETTVGAVRLSDGAVASVLIR